MNNRFLLLFSAFPLALSGCSGKKTPTYKVTFDYPGYDPVYVKEGEKVSKPEDPYKEPTAQYSYAFHSWYHGNAEWDFDNDIVNSDMTLVPVFDSSLNSYTISFLNGEEVLQSSKFRYGATPVYYGDTPVKEGEGDKVYVFDGWDHEITKVTKDDAYHAVFTEKERGLEFMNVPETYYPYDEIVRNYLEAQDPDVSFYSHDCRNQFVPLTIRFRNDFTEEEGLSSLTFEYATREDFMDAISIPLALTDHAVTLQNLLKNQEYHVRLTASFEEGEARTAVSSFRTADLGPRALFVDGVFNTRDIGGYVTESGKTVKQNVLIRGGAMSDSTDSAYDDIVGITEEGKKTLSEDFRIVTDFDLRSKDENLGLTESPIPGAKLSYYGTDGYMSAFTLKSTYCKVFRDLAKADTYPAYIHCTGGADRTGTVCAILESLLGMKERDIIHDYEFTTFSIYGTRSSKAGSTFPFYDFFEKLKSFDGDTLADKAASYLLDIGVTEEEIASIRAIFLD